MNRKHVPNDDNMLCPEALGLSLVANLWHTCHSGLNIIIENSKRFTITGLDEDFSK